MIARKHILIADPEAGFRFSAAVALRKAGYRTSIAASGLDALAQALHRHKEGDRIDLLIVDCGIRDLPGAELPIALRNLDVPVPVFAIAENFDAPLLGEITRAGCVGHLEKPFPPDELVRCVERVTKKDAA